MKIGIVILHWKDVEQTTTVLQSILEWTTVQPTIFLVQNESTKDSFPQFKNEKIIKLYAEKNIGFGGGNNLALEASINLKMDFTLLLNPDAKMEEKEFTKLTKAMEEDGNIFSIGPIINEFAGGKKKEYIGGQNIAKNINTRINYNQKLHGNLKMIEVDYTIGAIILIRNKHLKKIGFFDTDYFFSGEVADLCYRAKLAGLKSVTLINSIGFHFTEDHSLRSNLYKYYSFRNRFVFMQKFPVFKKHIKTWYKILIKELIYTILTFNFNAAKTMFITLSDVLRNVKGNQNEKFKKYL